MTVTDLLHALAQMDIRLSVSNGKLKINAPAGALTPELTDLVRERRNEILAVLAGDWVSASSALFGRIVATVPEEILRAMDERWNERISIATIDGGLSGLAAAEIGYREIGNALEGGT